MTIAANPPKVRSEGAEPEDKEFLFGTDALELAPTHWSWRRRPGWKVGVGITSGKAATGRGDAWRPRTAGLLDRFILANVGKPNGVFYNFKSDAVERDVALRYYSKPEKVTALVAWIAQQGGPVQAAQTTGLNGVNTDLVGAPAPPPAAALPAPVVLTAVQQAPNVAVKVEPKLKQSTKRNTKLARPVARTAIPVKKEKKDGQKVPKVTSGGSRGRRGSSRGRGGAGGARVKR